MSRDSAPDEPRDDGARRIAAVMSHPQQAKVFFAAADRTFGVGMDHTADVPDGITIGELAAKLGESNRRVRYHLASLLALGFVEKVAVQQRRGVVEHYYRVTQLPLVTKSDVEGGGISAEEQRRLSIEILKSLFGDASAALSAGTYTRRPEWIAGRVAGEVDERGWEELAAVQESALADAQEVVLRAKGRLEATEDNPVPVRAGLLLFEAAA